MNKIDIKNIDTLNDGEVVKITGVITDVHHTPNVSFLKITDGSVVLQLVSFVTNSTMDSNIVKDSLVTATIEKNTHQGRVQGKIIDAKIETEDTSILKAINSTEKYKAVNQDLFFNTDDWKKLKPSLLEFASTVKQAVHQNRPIIISHHGDCDGFAAGIILENAITGLIKSLNPDVKYLQQYITRNSSRTPFYDVIDATKDIATFTSNQERFDLKKPLIIIADNGSTYEDMLAIQKTKLFGADIVVIDHHDPGQLDSDGKSLVCKEVLAHVNPHLVGLSKEFSAAMLAFQAAIYINEQYEPNIFAAAAGGVTDRCDGEPIDLFVKASNVDKSYFEKLGIVIDLEIFFTKFSFGKLPLKELFMLNSTIRDKIMEMYTEKIDEWAKEITVMVDHYKKEKTIGNFKVMMLNGETLTMRGDYFSIGKLAGLSHKVNEEGKDAFITIVHTDGMLVYRAKQTSDIFDGNKLIAYLQEELPYARITGGGHNVAGSIKFIPAAFDEILGKVEKYIENLK